MHRHPLLSLLKSHRPVNKAESQMLHETIAFVEKHADCFERSLQDGHITGSAWILNPERTHVLLIHHVKLDKWLQPGGHCDGDPDTLQVSMKEALEETFLVTRPLSDAIFDVDNHTIPQRREIPAHIHYDIRFLLEADKAGEEMEGNEEVHTMRWIPLDKVHEYNPGDSILRMVQKTVILPQHKLIMISSTLSQLHWYRIISPNFAKAIDFALNSDLAELETGLHGIDGEKAFAMVNEYSTKKAADCEWESHHAHADIQIMIEGSEKFGYAPLVDQQPTGAFHSGNDVVFYSIPTEESGYIPLYPGQFIIFFPSDIHRPEVANNEPAPVKKMVIKVKL